VGYTDPARAIERTVEAAVAEGRTTTDIGGPLGTREVGDWIASHLHPSSAHSRPAS